MQIETKILNFCIVSAIAAITIAASVGAFAADPMNPPSSQILVPPKAPTQPDETKKSDPQNAQKPSALPLPAAPIMSLPQNPAIQPTLRNVQPPPGVQMLPKVPGLTPPSAVPAQPTAPSAPPLSPGPKLPQAPASNLPAGPKTPMLPGVPSLPNASGLPQPPGAAANTLTAQTRQAVQIAGPFAAGLVTWQCHGNICHASGASAASGLEICRSLVEKVGVLSSFSAAGRPMDGDELNQCNQAPSPGLMGRTISRMRSSAELARIKQLFNELKAERDRAAADAKAKFNSLARNASPAPTASGVVPKIGAVRLPQPERTKHSQGRDCDDSRADVHPGATEICDNIDNNCNGFVDEDRKILYFLDADGDLHGDPARRIEACPEDASRARELGQWLSETGNDCDDSDPTRWRDCR